MARLASPSGGVPADTPHRFIYPATLCWAGLRAQSLARRVSARAVAFWLGTDTNPRAATPPTYPAVRRPLRPPAGQAAVLTMEGAAHLPGRLPGRGAGQGVRPRPAVPDAYPAEPHRQNVSCSLSSSFLFPRPSPSFLSFPFLSIPLQGPATPGGSDDGGELYLNKSS